MKNDPDNAAEILKARARVLAKPEATPSAAKSSLELLEFSLANERYAVECRWVTEACPLKDLTPLPGLPPFIRGIVNVRGRILPVFDLKKLFDLPEKGLTDLHRIILVRSQDLELGLLADAVAGVFSILADSLQPSLPTLTGIRGDYLLGVTGDRLVVLDLARIFADPKIIVHEEVEIQPAGMRA